MAFFGRLWRGEYSLPMTYWVYGVVVGIVYSFIQRAAMLATGEVGAGFILAIIYLPYYVIVTGGVWRSANKYCATEGKSAFWGRLAQVAVVLGWLATLGGLVVLAENL